MSIPINLISLSINQQYKAINSGYEIIETLTGRVDHKMAGKTSLGNNII